MILSALEPKWGCRVWRGRLWELTAERLSENKEGVTIIPSAAAEGERCGDGTERSEGKPEDNGSD